MSRPVGRNIPLSRTRRLISDMLHFCSQVPLVTVDRRMDLAPLAAARRACAVRPSWCGLFVRAFAIVAARQPELRRSYLSFPWPHLYEHPESMAAVMVERDWDGEPVPFCTQISAPDRRALGEFDDRLQRDRERPIGQFPALRRLKRMLMLPRPLRRLVWWAALNVHGPTRARFIGTYVVSSVCAHGAGALQVLGPTTCFLHYGMMDEHGSADIRLTFDHRVFDGAPAARALVELEGVLLKDLLTEVRGMRQAQAA